MKTCVIIPTLNESKTIASLVREIKKYEVEVLIVDDGSRDNTFLIAHRCGALVLRNEQNKGKGASLIKGFEYALQHDFDAVITMDGDGQHLPQEIPFFLRLARYSDKAIFIGDRLSKKKNMPFVRLATNTFMSWVISEIAGQKISDSQCGLRLIKKEVLKKIKLVTAKYETESELLIKASRAGFTIESVPITCVYINEKSHINPFVDSLRFISFIIKELWTSRY